MAQRFAPRARLLGAAAMFGLMAMAAPAARPPALAAVASIQPGQWELREQGALGAPRVMCITDADMLIQLRHGGAQCTRFIVENRASSATVSYQCIGTGSGRTTISVDTPRQFRLQTQGVAQGAPFDIDYAARRLGDCTAAVR